MESRWIKPQTFMRSEPRYGSYLPCVAVLPVTTIWHCLTVCASQRVVAPDTINPRIGKALSDVVVKSIAIDKNERYQTAQAFRRALVDALPSAMTVDSPQIEELLRGVMADEIRAQREQLDTLTIAASDVNIPDVNERAARDSVVDTLVAPSEEIINAREHLGMESTAGTGPEFQYAYAQGSLRTAEARNRKLIGGAIAFLILVVIALVATAAYVLSGK